MKIEKVTRVRKLKTRKTTRSEEFLTQKVRKKTQRKGKAHL